MAATVDIPPRLALLMCSEEQRRMSRPLVPRMHGYRAWQRFVASIDGPATWRPKRRRWAMLRRVLAEALRC